MKKNNKAVDITTETAVNMLKCAYMNARIEAQRMADEFIKLNPEHAKRRNDELAIEILGIDNLYCRMFEEIKRAEKISRSGGVK